MPKFLSLFLSTSLMLMPAVLRAESPPNVLLVTVDTLRADHLGCYGYNRPTSPNVDALAADATLFQNAYAHASLTAASFASLFTSLYPSETGILTNQQKLPDGLYTMAEMFKKAGYHTSAVVSNYVLRKEMGFAQGFDAYDDRMEDYEKVRKLPERKAPRTTGRAVEWLKKNKGNPFFLWVHYQDPHGPYEPPADHVKSVNRVPLQSPDKKLKILKTHVGVGGIPQYQVYGDERMKNSYVNRYDGEIHFFDAEFGKLLSTLRKQKLYDNTVIIFTADHGEGMGEHKVYFAHDDYLYQEFVRVPLIIKHATKREAYAPRVQLADVLPTIAAIAGIEGLKTWRGQDLFSPTYRSVDLYMEIAKAAALVRGNLSLIFNKGKKEFQLFDLLSDPGELINTYKSGVIAPHVLDMERVLNENMTLKGFTPEIMADEFAEEALEKLRSLGYSQ